MAYLQGPFWQFIDHWQTLATGLLALFAGVGTVWATTRSASRAIAAAQRQTNMAQQQIATTLQMEHRRRVREESAFYAVLEAAMGIVLEDAEAARQMFPISAVKSDSLSLEAYQARQRIRKSSFAELRSACLSLGSPLMKRFLSLDNEIDVFAAQWRPAATGGLTFNAGSHRGFHESLDGIEAKSRALQVEAGQARQECVKALATPDFVAL